MLQRSGSYCTVREKAACWVMEPDTAVTSTVYVPAGVLGPPPQPVIPEEPRIASRARAPIVSRRWRSRRRRNPRRGRTRSPPATANATRPECDPGPVSRRSSAAEVLVSVLMVRVEVAFPETAGVTEDAEKVQVESLGRPVQLRFVALAKPLVEVTVTVTVAGVPALTETLEDESETEKSGVPGQTVTATADDVEAALFPSPEYVAVTL